jgi:hypothetical protein
MLKAFIATVAVKTTMICINVRVENTFSNKTMKAPYRV